MFRKDPNTLKTLNTDLTTIAHMMCKHGHFDILEWIYPLAGGDCGVKNTAGLTALHFACINGHTDIAKYLIKNMSVALLGATCNGGKTALH